MNCTICVQCLGFIDELFQGGLLEKERLLFPRLEVSVL